MSAYILELADKYLVIFKFYSNGDYLEGERLIRVQLCLGICIFLILQEKIF